MTALQAVKNAVKILPKGQTRSDLMRLARLIDYRKRPASACADTGAVILRFDDADKRPTKRPILSRKTIIPVGPPMCQECDEEMVRYEDAVDTGRGGYMCMSCGWSEDDPR